MPKTIAPQRVAVAVLGLTALTGSLSPTPAHSQPAANCAAIQADADRLKCYDAAATAKPGAPKIDPVIAKARAAILQRLKDPESARFEGIVKRPEAVCGFVNAKNSQGGYTGRKPFIYMIKSNQGWILEVGAEGVQQALAAAETHCSTVPGF